MLDHTGNSSPEPKPRFMLQQDSGKFLRSAMLYPSKIQGCTLEVTPTDSAKEALRFCTAHSASLMAQLIAIHFSGSCMGLDQWVVIERFGGQS